MRPYLVGTLATLGMVALAAHAADTFDPATTLLSLDTISLGSTTYRQVRATVSSYTLLGVNGGSATPNSFDTTSNLLTLGAIGYQGSTYNNARVHINNYVVLSASTGSADAIFGNLAAADLGIGANLNGAVPFPADNAWNTDISSAAIDPNSDTLIAR